MSLTLSAGPANPPLVLQEAKDALRIDGTDDDALIDRYIAAATAYVDGRDGVLGRALVTQTWALTLDEFPSEHPREIRIPLPPLQSVTSITYVDTNGDTQTLSTSLYQVIGASGWGKAKIVEAYNQTWPSTRDQPEAVTVSFVAGYGDDWNGVPEAIRQAMTLMVGDMYRFRETTTERQSYSLPFGSEALLAPYRVYGFG